MMRWQRRWRRWRRRTEEGSAIVELVWLGLLLLIPITYIVITAFELQRGAFATSAAARAAGRAYALSDNDAQGQAQAEAVARRAFADQGIADTPREVTVTCVPEDVCLSGGSVITVRIDSRIDLPLLPEALGGQRPAVAVGATHTVAYGQFQENR